MDRRTAIQGMAGVSMAQPVGGDIQINLRPLCRRPHDAQYLRGIKMPLLLAGGKDRAVEGVLLTLEALQRLPGRGGPLRANSIFQRLSDLLFVYGYAKIVKP